MTAITSVTLGGLELLTPGTFGVGYDTYFALHAGIPREPRLVDMAGRHPAYVGKTDQARSIPILVFLLDEAALQRMTDYQALLAATLSPGLVAVTWTESGTTRRYWCHFDAVDPSAWLTRVAISAIAPNPEAEVV